MIRAPFAFLLAALALVAPGAALADAASEAAASAAFDHAADNRATLRLFLQAMPKGGDLHNHLSGAVYAEDYLMLAAETGWCADETGTLIVPPPCPPERSLATVAERQPFVFDRLIDSLSTRGMQHGMHQGGGANAASGHSQFFSSFGRFGAMADIEQGRWLAAARRSAARDHVTYLELMIDPPVVTEYARAAASAPLDERDIPAAYAREAPALGSLVDRGLAQIDAAEVQARQALACGTASADPACDVAVRYLAFAARGIPPAAAYRTMILAFALADRDPRFVGVNIVMPEDHPIAVRDYDLHMAMFRFLESKYPKVRVSMHAGELTLGRVRPSDLRDHIAKAVASGAQRIGHGTDIAFEDDAQATLARMARQRIAVEINLSSAAVILGVSGGDHPLRLYREAGVPVVLATDDEGVLRSDMTNEYHRAVTEQGLRYADLKALARASLEYAFVPGASLWRDGPAGTPVAACASRGACCAALLKRSEKARLQADLEDRFDRFEKSLAGVSDSPRL